MISNNFRALLIHIFVNVISFYLYFTFNIKAGIAEYATQEAYQAHVREMIFISIIIVGLALTLYFIGGRLLLKNQGSIAKNILSVSSVAVIGVVWWLIILPLTELEAFNKSNLWTTFSVYVSYILSLVENMENEMPLILLASTFVPPLVMALSIKKKKLEVNLEG